ncbi:uncharacterized protein LOC106132082 [Amyelois transitella]|uniref:uncharacterized protein LOC106132082 n=1 Tax=Amyelois transitella TaxID=680683 RepID=UPI00298F9577|nr:uncharacterized protein LOC106132082 [Amyelois transitella]
MCARMNFYVLIVILALGYSDAKKLVHLPTEKSFLILPQIMKCADETGVNFEELNYLLSESKDHHLDKNAGNFISCSFRRTGYANSKGNVNMDKFLNLFPKENREAVRKVAVDCDDIDSTNVSEKLYKFVVCFLKTSPVLLML